MELIEHEWIENFKEYEAVLRCLNPLADWDKHSTIRAFQTFDWNLASVPGGELEFGHKNTPVVVRYDGSVAAILFGLGQLKDAIPDLFGVLHSLGWKTAEVYHPAASLANLLSDFGKAIPANMDFDIKPAKSEQRVSDFAEAKLLFVQGRIASNASSGDANSIILAEMIELAPVFHDGPTKLAPSDAFAEMVLEDDVNDSTPGEFVKPIESNPQSTSVHSEDLPRVSSAFGLTAQAHAELVIENERLRDALSVEQIRSVGVDQEVVELVQAQENAMMELKVLVAAMSVAEKNLAQNADVNLSLVHENERLNSLLENSANVGFKVGLSAFCFDLPNNQISNDGVTKLAKLHGTNETIHLYPGLAGVKNRWNLFGEITLEQPWYSETLVKAMGFEGADILFVCKQILGLKHSNPTPQLRDLMTDLANHSVGEILGPISLCPDGDAFVDIAGYLHSPDVEVFSVRGVFQSTASRLFVVHLDAIDGDFVYWMVELLQFVVKGQATSKKLGLVDTVDDSQTIASTNDAFFSDKIYNEGTDLVENATISLDRIRSLECV